MIPPNTQTVPPSGNQVFKYTSLHRFSDRQATKRPFYFVYSGGSILVILHLRFLIWTEHLHTRQPHTMACLKIWCWSLIFIVGLVGHGISSSGEVWLWIYEEGRNLIQGRKTRGDAHTFCTMLKLYQQEGYHQMKPLDPSCEPKLN